MSREDTKGWIEVASTGDDEKANLIAGMLKAAGIPSQVDGPGPTPFPEDLGAFGQSRIVVPPDRAEEARQLLSRVERERGDRSSGRAREE